MDFGLLPLDEFHTSFHIREDTHKDFMLTDALEMHFIDMVKWRKLDNRLRRLSPEFAPPAWRLAYRKLHPLRKAARWTSAVRLSPEFATQTPKLNSKR